MAWLLAQRAVQCGELSRDAALAEPLAALDICMDGEDREGGSLPPRLGALLGRIAPALRARRPPRRDGAGAPAPTS